MLAKGQRRRARSTLALFSLKVQLITSLTQLAGEKPSLHGFALRICILQFPSTLDLSLLRPQQLEHRKQALLASGLDFRDKGAACPGRLAKLSLKIRQALGRHRQPAWQGGLQNAARQGDLPLSTSRASSKVAGGRRQQEQMDEWGSQTTPAPQMLAPYHLSQAGPPSVPGALRDEKTEGRDRWLWPPEYRETHLTKTCFCCHNRFFLFVLFNNYH